MTIHLPPSLVPLEENGKRYQVLKQTTIPAQLFVEDDVVIITLPIPFVFVQDQKIQSDDTETAALK